MKTTFSSKFGFKVSNFCETFNYDVIPNTQSSLIPFVTTDRTLAAAAAAVVVASTQLSQNRVKCARSLFTHLIKSKCDITQP